MEEVCSDNRRYPEEEVMNWEVLVWIAGIILGLFLCVVFHSIFIKDHNYDPEWDYGEDRWR